MMSQARQQELRHDNELSHMQSEVASFVQRFIVRYSALRRVLRQHSDVTWNCDIRDSYVAVEYMTLSHT